MPLEPAREAALEWVVRLHSGLASPGDHAAYAAWKAADPAHAAAAAEAERSWAAIGAAPRPRPSRRRAVIAAGLVLGAGAFGASRLPAIRSGSARLLAEQRTAVGELRRLTLPDGSALEMDTATSLDLDFAADRRRILLHAGRIHVEVAPDAARPFLVAAAGGDSQARGTAFSVARSGAEVRVLVTRHSVQVRYGGAETLLQEGQEVDYSPAIGLGRPRGVNLAAATAWQRGQLVFNGEPLGEVVATVSRYRRGWLLLRGEALAQRRVTGVFPTGDTEAFLQALPALLPVRIRRLPLLDIIEPLGA
ncbi:FecR family protein [Siccirubricoccus phaeus]|uniref:FecR family protein n=1 Tax=Siccirubricoccus phaeus TaxID=2595053 RepID=UPI001A9C31BE|nr:FecR domain-containing protein [Siccirubricoccus phaeus]